MKLIVGLGNPGPQYAPTRHNVGFRVVDKLAHKRGWRWNEERSRALLASGWLGREKVILVKPLTYMNLSGEAVGALARWYRLSPQDILVVCDDLDLPVGRLRLRARGSTGGHNGLESIVHHLHSDQFPRLRVGIGRPTERHTSVVDYVLGVPPPAERAQLDQAEDEAVAAIELVLARGLEAAMSVINRDPEARRRSEEQRQRQQARRPPIQLGMVARLFPAHWRPLREEIAFARSCGFQWLQLRSSEAGLTEQELGDSFETLTAALHEAGLTCALEIALSLTEAGTTASGATLATALHANLAAIRRLPCSRVHFHLLAPLSGPDVLPGLEERLVPALQEAQALAAAQTPPFSLGIEQNEPAAGLFARPDRCAWLLEQVPGLGLVWDVNHTPPETLQDYLRLTPRMILVHVSDTPLPQLNYHLPLGLGTLDIEGYCEELLARGFAGPAILEIGGTPRSGGFGRDSDEALQASAQRLRAALGRAYARLRSRLAGDATGQASLPS
ncbi:aminoacyl-tRNA hydrolase [Thermogemmatispora sp.]|uniref:aminoacyl-tRNA hydrolase n=1 Tax=Thermogemmatispora sp. TaxID=1968838 RepID=UPI001DA1E817|nr:aminoacyl-tRNA hydrolase [Thermogemmatispora sp.]MBX5450761.1 aminoacyl-tRNA hydrolase [Thermogemmatispora sp.]